MTPLNHLRNSFVYVVNGIGVKVGKICEAVVLVGWRCGSPVVAPVGAITATRGP